MALQANKLRAGVPKLHCNQPNWGKDDRQTIIPSLAFN